MPEKTITQRVKLMTDSISCQDCYTKITKVKCFISKIDLRSHIYQCNKCELMKSYATSNADITFDISNVYNSTVHETAHIPVNPDLSKCF